MQKTKLGISVGLLGCAMYLCCLFGGYIAAVLLAGYILLMEENIWLKKSAVKGIALLFGIALLSALINLIPNAIGFIDDICNVFGGNLYIAVVNNVVDVVDSALNLVGKVLCILLAIKALTQGTIKLPVIDALIDKHMN